MDSFCTFVSWEDCFGFSPSTEGKQADKNLKSESAAVRSSKADLRSKITGICTHLHPAVSRAHIDVLPSLRVISNHGVGVEHINLKDAKDKNVPVSNTPGCLQTTTADMAWALLLAAARNVVAGDAVARAPATVAFDPNWYGKEVSGATLGIVGLGAIGREVAQRGVGFGMKVLYTGRRRKTDSQERVLGHRCEFVKDLHSLLHQSDFVVLCCPATPATEHMIDAAALSAMKSDAILVNIGRGSLVDQEALARALADRKLRAAALDVTSPEPLPRSHALLQSPHCVITPHTGSATHVARQKMVQLCLQNLRRGLANQPLLSPCAI
mmetsp:Transcript_34840/g.68452  ORF Transcript_34840/g.68452 Transcript_34840/m.68452 type:complete len:325 (-) Transcript_34840:381-1355(-)